MAPPPAANKKAPGAAAAAAAARQSSLPTEGASAAPAASADTAVSAPPAPSAPAGEGGAAGSSPPAAAQPEGFVPLAGGPPEPPPPPSTPEPPPALAEAQIGPEPPVPPAPPPPPAPAAAPPHGEQFDEQEPPSSKPKREIRPLPLRGALLRCDDFAEAGPGVAVQAEVIDTDDDEGHVLLWIESLKRRWVVSAARIHGDRWTHVPGDYPKPGEHARFDARFRSKVATASAAPSPPPAPPTPPFVPPRKARAGFVWVSFKQHGISAVGFTEKGESKTHEWKKDQVGEISLVAVNGSPTLFERL